MNLMRPCVSRQISNFLRLFILSMLQQAPWTVCHKPDGAGFQPWGLCLAFGFLKKQKHCSKGGQKHRNTPTNHVNPPPSCQPQPLIHPLQELLLPCCQKQKYVMVFTDFKLYRWHGTPALALSWLLLCSWRWNKCPRFGWQWYIVKYASQACVKFLASWYHPLASLHEPQRNETPQIRL